MFDIKGEFLETKAFASGLKSFGLGTCTGRLFAYDVATKEIRTVIDGLCFANGVQLTRDEKTVIVPETARYRVSWIDVATAKKKHIIHLPGE